MTVDRLNPSFLPENYPTYQTFEAGAERESDSDTRNNSALASVK